MRHLDKMKNAKCPLCVFALPALARYTRGSFLCRNNSIVATNGDSRCSVCNFYSSSLVTSSVNFIASIFSLDRYRVGGASGSDCAPLLRHVWWRWGRSKKKRQGLSGVKRRRETPTSVSARLYLGHRNVARVDEWNNFILRCWSRSLKK